MKVRRQMYHTDGVTDIRRMREDAIASAEKGDPVVLHLHSYEEMYDGCSPLTRALYEHETYGLEMGVTT